MNDLERRTRERAYRIWLDEGCPEGRADTHWQMACEQISIEDKGALPEGAPEHPYSPSTPAQMQSESWFGFGRRPWAPLRKR
jgi:hypothetical protein